MYLQLYVWATPNPNSRTCYFRSIGLNGLSLDHKKLMHSTANSGPVALLGSDIIKTKHPPDSIVTESMLWRIAEVGYDIRYNIQC
jgi:hypothetical protein